MGFENRVLNLSYLFNQLPIYLATHPANINTQYTESLFFKFNVMRLHFRGCRDEISQVLFDRFLQNLMQAYLL